MVQSYSLSEVFRLAESIERNGRRFYTEAARATQHAKAKKIMEHLASQEAQHERLFAELRHKYCEGVDAHWNDPEGDAAAYLRAVAANHVFNLGKDVTELLASVQSPESTLRMAIGFEKDTIVFFSALRGAVDETARDKVDLLIQEELNHIRILQDAIVAL